MGNVSCRGLKAASRSSFCFFLPQFLILIRLLDQLYKQVLLSFSLFFSFHFFYYTLAPLLSRLKGSVQRSLTANTLEKSDDTLLVTLSIGKISPLIVKRAIFFAGLPKRSMGGNNRRTFTSRNCFQINNEFQFNRTFSIEISIAIQVPSSGDGRNFRAVEENWMDNS